MNFDYGPDQNRWAKHRIQDHFPTNNDYTTNSEWQVRDAQGNTLATYTRKVVAVQQTGSTTNPPPPYPGPAPDDTGGDHDDIYESGPNPPRFTYEFGPLRWERQFLYGSARLGRALPERELKPICHDCPDDDTNGPDQTGLDPVDGYEPNDPQQQPFLNRQYELTNHLGNVTVVFSEEVRPFETPFEEKRQRPILVAHNDYLPFGLRVGRAEAKDSDYRYGFNGKEIDEEGEWGSTTVYDYGFRVYTARQMPNRVAVLDSRSAEVVGGT